jgi:hypothetical protein
MLDNNPKRQVDSRIFNIELLAMFHQDSKIGVCGSGETHRGDVWEHPQILGKFMGDMGTSGSPTLKLKKYININDKTATITIHPM